MKPPASTTRFVGTRSSWRSLAFLLLAALVPVVLLWRGAPLRGVYFRADLVVYYLLYVSGVALAVLLALAVGRLGARP